MSVQTPKKTRWKYGDCKQKFKKKNSYYTHYHNIHSKQVSKTKSKPEKRSCICSACDKEYNYPSELAEHMRCHIKSILICEICHKVYKRTDHYTDHIGGCTVASSSFTERSAFDLLIQQEVRQSRKL